MKVGVLGGGQLGLMLSQAAQKLDHSCIFFDPSPDACAKQAGELIVADFTDIDALARFASAVDVVTYEFENVPIEAVHTAALYAPVSPSIASLEYTQDRLCERQLLEQCNIPIARYQQANDFDSLVAAVETIGKPGILKCRTGGYDGKGQFRINSDTAVERDLADVAAAGVIYERTVPFFRELSIVGTRSRDGEIITYPAVESIHEQGILVRTIADPFRISSELAKQARAYFIAIATKLDHVGTLAIELFDADEGLIVNELAPRVHNTGHWTIEGCSVSQFENHIRAVTNMELIKPTCLPSSQGAAVMLNLIGSIPDLSLWESDKRVSVHLYNKLPRPGRKVGHVTIVSDDASQAIALADEIDVQTARVFA